MRHIVGSIGVLLALSFLAGCGSSQRVKTQSPSDVFGVMDKELAHSVVGKVDGFDAMDAELSHAIGTTMLTSETVLASMPLPDSRMSIALELPPPVQTWGVAAEEPKADPPKAVTQIDLSEIPETRD